MRFNNKSRKAKNNPFQTYRDPKTLNNAKSNEEKQIVEGLNSMQKYTAQQPMPRHRGRSFKNTKNSGVNLNMAVNYSFMDLGKEMRSKRTLIDENNQLKRKLQSLANVKMSKRQLTTKKISTEFEKELYWNGPQTHMISGVKYQYQKMKESYIKKSDEYDELIRSVAVSSTMQFMSYIEALQLQNHILARKVETKNKALEGKSHYQLQEITNKVLQDYESKYESKLRRWKQKMRKSRIQNKQLKSKIQFLQKLLIQKDNNQHNSKRVAKRFQKEKGQLEIKLKNMELTLKNIQNEHSKATQQLKKSHTKELAKQKQNQIIFQRQQQQLISRLQKQNRYLHSLVQSWKDQKNPKNTKKEMTSTKKIEKSNSHNIGPSQPMNQNIQSVSINLKKPQKNESAFMHLQKQEQQAENIRQTIIRKSPFTADKKNSDNSIKNRRIQLHQIQQSIEYGRCILIGKGISLDSILQKFQGEDDEQSKQYINMKQVKQICLNYLQLNSNQAQNLARYLIQHSNLEYVYTDDINEHDRAIVKSIIKNLLGKYSVYENEKEKFQLTLSESKSKLEWTLQNTTKGGIINQDKFTDLLQSLSLNTPGFTTYCISKMALHSESLQKLKISSLFSSEKKE